MVNNLNRHFIKQGIQMGHKYMNKCLPVTKEKQTKNKTKYHYTLGSVAKIQQKTDKTKWCQRYRVIGSLIHCW